MNSAIQHNNEIHQNLVRWQRRPLLQVVYRRFYELIAAQVRSDLSGKVVELGSGIGNLKTVLPDSITTDLFRNPWIDQVETAYALSFGSGEVSNIILFDVFHHLEFPGTALDEFRRVLVPAGRVIIFDPAISLLGWLVYGACHHEPIAWGHPITWTLPPKMDPKNAGYYAAQGNATRVFAIDSPGDRFLDWNVVLVRRLAAISYVASGGYSGPQLYPASWLPLLTMLDRLCDHLPKLFATRLLVVLEKK